METCRRGHPRTDENTLIRSNGQKACKVCNAMKEKIKPPRKQKRYAVGVKCLCKCGKIVNNKSSRCRESRMKLCPRPGCTTKIEPYSRTCKPHKNWPGSESGFEV